jgi:hypothetical protein
MLMRTRERDAVSAPWRGWDGADRVWEGPLFVVGMPRSGTKMLRGLLSQHPNIRMLGAETEFLPFLDRWVEQQGEPDTAEKFETLFGAMRNAAYFHFRKAAEPFDCERWRAACEERFDTAGLFEGFMRYELDMSRGTGVVWGDKSPAYVRCIPMLLRHYPHAKVIHLVRDVRDYCVSIRKAWKKDIRRAAARWGQDVNAAHEACVLHAPQCIEVRYEALLQDTRGEMRRICDSLDLGYCRTLDDLSQSVENYGDAKGQTTILRGNFNKFEQRLTAWEIEQVESLAWNTLLEMGYVCTRAKGPRQLTPQMQRWLRVKDGMHLMLSDIPRHGLVRALRLHTGHQQMIAH